MSPLKSGLLIGVGVRGRNRHPNQQEKLNADLIGLTLLCKLGLELGPRIINLIGNPGTFPKFAFRVTLLLIVLYIMKVF